MKLKSTLNLPQHPKYMLIYGASGLGKTTLISTLPDPSKVLVLDAEGGLLSLQHLKLDVAVKELATDDTGKLLSEAERFEEFKKFIDFVKTAECAARFNVLFIDSLTEIAQNIFRHMKEKHGDGFKLWGEYTTAVQDLIKFFRDLNHYTVIFTALEECVEDKETGLSSYFPNLGGRKVKEAVLPAFDLVSRMVIDADKNRLLICKPTIKTQAKDRVGLLEDIEQPNLAAIMKKMEG
jgi:phage nucleotide-binding protein